MEDQPTDLSSEGHVMRNLTGAKYKMSCQPMSVRVTSMTSFNHFVFIGTLNEGCYVYRISNNNVDKVCRLSVASGDEKVKGNSCYDLAVSKDYTIYSEEGGEGCRLCVHRTCEVLEGKVDSIHSLPLKRRAPVALDHGLALVAVGGSAWVDTWTTKCDNEKTSEDSQDGHLKVLELPTLKLVREWKVADNSVHLLRTRTTASHSLLGVADSRTGLKVFDLRQPTESEYVCLYQAAVEEVRNFELVDNFIAVFHKFEPNVSFWNITEQKTILCINIQDQMKQIADEYQDDADEDYSLFGDDDDHVTCVTSVPHGDDSLLIYGTKSGCIFGMSVQQRCKLFTIACERRDGNEEPPVRMGVQGVVFLPHGKLATFYEKRGLAVFDFNDADMVSEETSKSSD